MAFRALNCQRWGIALLALLPTLNAPPAAASPIYSLIELGNFGGDTFAWGINNSGQVSGYSYDTSVGQNRAFLYGAGVTTNLGTIGAPSNYSIGFAINDAGQVAGGTTSSTYGPLVSRGEGVVWSEGTSTVLPTLGGYEDEPGFGAALGINNSGQVTGTSSNGVANHSHALLYSNGTITDLGTLGGPNSEGRAINDRGEVAGGAGLSFSNTGLAHAYIYSGGFMTDLGTLGGLESIAFGINNLGQVVGGSRTLRGDIIGAPDAFIWSGGIMSDLGILPRALGSVAYGINDKGIIVGQDQGGDGGINHAVLWLDNLPLDLNTLLDSSGAGWTLEAATDVNDSGQIVGFGLNGEGQTRAFVLTEVPEPATFALLASGAVVARKFRSKKQHPKNRSAKFRRLSAPGAHPHQVTIAMIDCVCPYCIQHFNAEPVDDV